MENSEFKPVKLHLKIDLVSYPAWAEGLVNMDSTLSGATTPGQIEPGSNENLEVICIP